MRFSLLFLKLHWHGLWISEVVDIHPVCYIHTKQKLVAAKKFGRDRYFDLAAAVTFVVEDYDITTFHRCTFGQPACWESGMVCSKLAACCTGS